MDRFEVHTNFTNTPHVLHAFELNDLADADNLRILRAVFFEPEALKPGVTIYSITEQAAERFGQLADGMRIRGVPAHDAAHFLMKLMFCMFAEDIGLLPNQLFKRILAKRKDDPEKLKSELRELFQAMSIGGDFALEDILHFNGGLFADADVIDLLPGEIAELILINEHDWGSVEPSVFGTLFERTLDPAKRSQIGAHYTSRQDIETLLEPVVMQPLRREWDDVRTKCDKLNAEGAKAKTAATKRKKFKQRDLELRKFDERLAHVSILDPACGSGNFLYVALHLLLNLEKEVIRYGSQFSPGLLPQVRPTQLAGIEINQYAQELASVVIWIGYLQWMHDNGFKPPSDPVLEPIESIHLMDAILDLSDPENPKEPEWPKAEFIVGNPPFLGDKKMRSEFGSEYVDGLFKLYDGRIPNQSDLCCYWFEKANASIQEHRVKRAGLLATQGIRGGASRAVLKRIKNSGDIFFCESDRDWVLDGANVHVSMVGFDNGSETNRLADGKIVTAIHSNLSSADVDVTLAQPLASNCVISFQGPVKVGPFELDDAIAHGFLEQPNPSGIPTSDVVRPWLNGIAITRRQPAQWIIDFHERSLEHASLFQSPFEYVKTHVKPKRDKTRRERRRRLWWIHGETNNSLRDAVRDLDRIVATCQTAKHRVYVWVDTVVLPAQTVIAFARSDDYFFGVLHSRIHEVWGLVLGTRLETRPRYTPTTCFETFPFPEPTDEQRDAIADTAMELDTLRNNWLNPPEWTKTEVLEFPGSVDGPWKRFVEQPNDQGIGTVRYPRLVPKDEETAKALKKRTLTNLYNERPTWLDLAHQKLDAAVFAAYGWDPGISDDELLAALLALNLQRASEEQS